MSEPLTRDELLILLIEECGEVIQAATKCLRFGWDRFQPGYGQNDVVLGSEIGDLLGVIDALPESDEAQDERLLHQAHKIEKAERVKAEFGRTDSQ